eukprot:PhM_4_TR11359/c0_g1_i1/m.1567
MDKFIEMYGESALACIRAREQRQADAGPVPSTSPVLSPPPRRPTSSSSAPLQKPTSTSSLSASPTPSQCNKKKKKQYGTCFGCAQRTVSVHCFDCPEGALCELCHRQRHLGDGCGIDHQVVALRMLDTTPWYDEDRWRVEHPTLKGTAHCRVCRRFIYRGREAVAMVSPRVTIYFHPECHDVYFLGGHRFTTHYAKPGAQYCGGHWGEPGGGRLPSPPLDVDKEIREAVRASLERSSCEREEGKRAASGCRYGDVAFEDRPDTKYRMALSDLDDEDIQKMRSSLGYGTAPQK